mmetsp:Transcript_67704/g.181055  ORF Transcript_67704/g.181055 Transcript_67704/m.181055 type:complete len:239 (+) Transcript_67704:52-768(+)
MREDSVRAYNVFRAIGGDFTMASQKAQSEYDILERTHSRLPGPGEYSPLLTDNNKFRGKFGSANPKSELDWIQLRQSALPGPASYRTETAGLGKCIGKSASRSAVISRGNLPTFVDLSMTRASKIPGPGQYKPEVHTIGWRTRQQAPLWVGPPPVTGPDSTDLERMQARIDRLESIQERQGNVRSPYETAVDFQLLKLKRNVHKRLAMSLDHWHAPRRQADRNMAGSLQAYLRGPGRR